ncbi:aminoglycoside phosphotransferase [Psychrobacillus glaciei]|uniref:Aminoglycoside phosphotransferase n=1 Tax=Psychrobacillus glaciei TaxID=2283160 RepID=A0A5J6SJB6_9BACI|nr:phosphotransferase [Psychrobacillus glaciei]QFF97709.1 aminoglycoside phosphotransferase [Psychrobacillus glaciei]
MMELSTMKAGFSSLEVAESLLQHWKHDEGTLIFWRASSNFVCAFERKGIRFFLRFSFEDENTLEQIKEELDFMEYLKKNNFPCVSPILSLNNNFIETVKTSDGGYFGVVFSAASGTHLDEEEDLLDSQLEQWGRSLATLHNLSMNYEIKNKKRKSWQDTLLFIKNVLNHHPLEDEAKKEYHTISHWLHSLLVSKNTYGLIHYDFQLDNLFYDAKDVTFEIIDFDDSMYHWFAQDVVTALTDELESEQPASKKRINAFLKGYRTKKELSEEDIDLFPMFLRFSKLYQFARLLRSMESSTGEDDPAWLGNLRGKLISKVDEIRKYFRE